MAKNMSEENNIDIKIILLGETGTGKTSLINTYYGGKFNENCESTNECETNIKKLEINNRQCIINIWDTAGQEKYRSITQNLLRGTDIVILVYDITRRDTFLELNYWFDVASLQLGNNAIFGVAGNKIDLFFSSQVTNEEGELFAKQKECIFSLTSAKENPKSFEELLTKLLERYLKNKNIIKQNEKLIISENKKEKKEKKKCC